MLNVETKVKTITGCEPDKIPEDVIRSLEPLIIKGLASEWPIVKAGLKSDDEASQYLQRFYQNESVIACLSDPINSGRIFYDEKLTGFNFQSVSTKLDFALSKFKESATVADPFTIYIGSTTIDTYLPGFRAENDLDINYLNPLVSIWISNKCRIAAHWDSPLNIACSVVGKRRFILFPPDQLQNLYVGPLEKTPAGQPISLVDFYNPDFEKYPKFREALKHALVADLEPGDALFIPSMWWHHVESLGSLNILVNYWFRNSPTYHGLGISALNHAILLIRDLPADQRAAWKNMFDYYVFNYDKENFKHIPDEVLGALGEITDDEARRIRAKLLSQLNR